MKEFDLDNHSINIKCPKCSKIISETIGKLKNDRIIICATCHEYFDIQDDEFQKGVKRAEDSIKNLTEALKKYGKK